MEIKTFALSNLRNEEHYQFQTEFDGLVKLILAQRQGRNAKKDLTNTSSIN